MAKYIDKQKLMQDIESTVIFTAKPDAIPTNEMRGANKAIERIKAAPAEDVVKVVRCVNCINFTEHRLNAHSGWCGNLDMDVKVSDFCSWGLCKVSRND